jgi:CorA-like Mg2+ transporter protein
MTPQKHEIDAPVPAGAVCWFDITKSADPDALLTLLAPKCEGLELEMLADLISPDEFPEGHAWHGGRVRLASSFAVHAPKIQKSGNQRALFTPSAGAVYEPVELLAGENWLITRWHDACHYQGCDPVERGLPPISRDGVWAAVEKRWIKCGGGNAGDLGVFVMFELALTYAPTHRRFLAALEEWELELYKSDGDPRELSEDQRELNDLWGARARLRDWLNPLNVPGLRGDPDKAWLPATNHEAVIAVDQRVDKALAALSTLGETLRSSFHLFHIKQSEAQRKRDEAVHRRVELLATALLVPTFVVGFYGANTWVPGEHQSWGFLVMVLAIVAFTCIAIVALRSMHSRRELEREAQTQRWSP